MATAYEATVRLRPADVGAGRESSMTALIRDHLPESARLGTDRDDDGRLLLTVAMPVVANDASEVQIAARDLVAAAVARAGLTEQAALLDDVSVAASS